MKLFGKNFGNDEKGTITIEFVIWLPFLLLWFVGTAVWFDAYRTRSHAAKVTYTIGDLVSRSEILTLSDIDNLYALEQRMLPRISNGLGLRVTSVEYHDDGAGGLIHSVQWSQTRGSNISPMTDADIDPAEMPIMSPLETVVIVDTYVPYIPMVDWVGITSKTLRTSVINAPRFYPSVTLDNG